MTLCEKSRSFITQERMETNLIVMTGIIKIKSGTYIFRDDHAHGNEIWAWEIHDEYPKPMTHKWSKIPNNAELHLFDIDNPPRTVSYQPLID